MKPVKRAIILCWAMLVVCFIVKLFGGNWFEIVCTNEHFSNVCKFVDSHIILSDFIGLILYVFAGYFVFRSMSLLKECNTNSLVFIFVSLEVVWLTHYLGDAVKTIAEIVLFAVTPVVLNKIQYGANVKDFVKRRWYLGLIGYATIVVFQAVSFLTRNIGIKVVDDSFFLTTILMIDYYIMVFLYYLYVKSWKGDKENG